MISFPKSTFLPFFLLKRNFIKRKKKEMQVNLNPDNMEMGEGEGENQNDDGSTASFIEIEKTM